MRFIPGFTFKIGQSTINQGPSLLQRTQIKSRGDGIFLVGHEYELLYIRPIENKYMYYFRDRTDKAIIKVEFSSPAEADAKLERLSGSESFTPPDYEHTGF